MLREPGSSKPFDMLTGATVSPVSLLCKVREMAPFVRGKPASQVPEDCRLLSSHQRSSYSLGALPFESGELESPLDLTIISQGSFCLCLPPSFLFGVLEKLDQPPLYPWVFCPEKLGWWGQSPWWWGGGVVVRSWMCLLLLGNSVHIY